MTAKNTKSYLSYLNKLVDQYNNTYHLSINKEPINADDSALAGKFETNATALSLKLKIELELLIIRIFLVKVTMAIVQEKYLSWILF